MNSSQLSYISADTSNLGYNKNKSQKDIFCSAFIWLGKSESISGWKMYIYICKPNNWQAYFCPAEVLDYIYTQPGSRRQAQSLVSE